MLIAMHWIQRELKLAILQTKSSAGPRFLTQQRKQTWSSSCFRPRTSAFNRNLLQRTCTNAQGKLVLSCARLRPQLRLDYRNQPLGEALDVAIEPVATYSGDLTILTLVNWGTGLALIGRDGRSESMMSRTSRFVFALPASGRLEAMRDDPRIVPTSSE